MRGRRRRHGFTLIEAVVALAIVGTIAVAVLGAFGAELRTASRLRGALPAVPLAEERMALLSTLEPRVLAMLPDSIARGAFAPPYADYRWEATVDELPDIPGLLQATVTVTWPDGRYAIETRHYRPDRRVAGVRP